MSEDKVSILLVDDHVENLVALEALLDDLNQNLVRAESGLQALRLLLQEEFALIILDVDMPIMSGFETAALIRQREKSRHTPIIFLTAINTTQKHAFHNAAQRKFQFVCLVQSNLKDACDDLRAAGKTLCRCIENGQSLRCYTAGFKHLVNDFGGRRACALQDQCRTFRLIAVAERLEQRFNPRERPRGPRTKGKKRVFSLSVTEPPSRVLARKARDHRIARIDQQRPGPPRRRAARRELQLA